MKTNVTKNELIGCLVGLIIAIILWLLIPYQTKLVELTRPGFPIKITARTFPKFAIGILFVSSFIESTINLYKMYKIRKSGDLFMTSETAQKLSKQETVLRPLVVIISILFFVLLFQKIGFLISAFLLCGGLVWYFGGKYWQIAVIGLGVPLIMYYLFKYILYVPL
jgi:divalent metal cation (Fe/Co/Zn/Cd) transporter